MTSASGHGMGFDSILSHRRVCRCGQAFRPRMMLPARARAFCSRACYYASLKVPLPGIYLRDGGRCHLCGDRVRWADASRDHVLPRSRGGRTTWVNIRLAHRSCNSVRGDRPIGPGTFFTTGRSGMRHATAMDTPATESQGDWT
jgi:hypothetical protein